MNTPDDLVELGRIGEPYGLKGWVNVLPSSEQPDVLLKAKQWWVSKLRNPEQLAARRVAQPKFEDLEFEAHRVLQSKVHADRLVAHFEGVEHRELALQFKGRRVYVSRSRFPALPDNEVYWVDLVGCEVVNLQGQALGLVKQVVDHGAHPILVVQGQGDADVEHLIPFVPVYVLDVDVSAKRIQADWQDDY